MSDRDRPHEAEAHAGTLPGIGQAAPNAATAATLLPTPATAATLAPDPALLETVDVPHAGTLRGPYAVVEPALQRISDGAYEVGEEIAAGGMGRILSAHDRRLRRDVVIKVTREGRIDPRFEREALITARLQHPSIVRVYEAGLIGDRPFYAMERVRGRSLEVILEETTAVRDRLALLPHALAVTDAIAYAHSEGVLHRDLKPSNVLIGPFGETVVIDWGLAKDLRATEIAMSSSEHPVSSDSSLTQAGSVMGTPSYMAPEQARGDASDERTDIYALGAMLYTLLSGVPPVRGRTTDEVLEQVSAGRRVPLLEREPTLPPELVTIVDRAMAFRAADRYPTAKAMADELRAFAAGKLVASHTYSPWRLFKRFVARHKLPVTVSAAALVILAITGVISVRGLSRARDAADDARATADVAREQAEKNLRDLNRSTDEFFRGQASEWETRDPSHTAAWLQRLSDRGLAEDRTHELAVAAARRGFAWELRGHTADIELLAISPDHALAATGSDDATIRVWNLTTRTSSAPLVGHVGPLEGLEFSPDGAHLASAGTDGAVYLWTVATGVGKRLVGHKNTVRAVAFSPDGTQLASTSEEGTIFIWDVATGAGRLLSKRAHGWRPIVWSHDGAQVIAGGFDGAIGYFDVATGKATIIPATRIEQRCFALSPNGKYLATGDENGEVWLWTAPGEGKMIASHIDVVRDLVFTPDEKQLISAGGDDVVAVYTLASGVRTELRGNTDGVKDLALSPDGSLVASAGVDGIGRVWPITGGAPRELRGHGTAIKGIGFASNSLVITASEDDHARMWRLDDTAEPPRGAELRAWLGARTNIEVHTSR